MQIPQFKNKKEEIKFMVENKQKFIDQKKMSIKHADAIYINNSYNNSINSNKSFKSNENIKEIDVKVVINTTNFMDSHSDVHMKGIWNKSLKEKKNFYLLQEHKSTFDGVISDDVKAYLENKSFKELGYDFDGTTEMLVFDATIKESDNPKMFRRYKEGKVQEHSVGMQYVKIEMAVNDKDYEEEFENWNKYYNEVANKSLADEKGYFWAIKEAKVLEGSAVLFGSNSITPTLEVKNNEPSNDTHKNIEPLNNTLNIDKIKKYLENKN